MKSNPDIELEVTLPYQQRKFLANHKYLRIVYRNAIDASGASTITK